MAQALQLFAGPQFLEDDGKMTVGNRCPADHPANPSGPVGQPQKPFRFGQGLPVLNDDAARTSTGAKFALQAVRQEVPRNRLHTRSDPAVFLFAVAPQMVMRVDSFG